MFFAASMLSVIPAHHTVRVLSGACGTTSFAYVTHWSTWPRMSSEKSWCAGSLGYVFSNEPLPQQGRGGYSHSRIDVGIREGEVP